jgi:phosphoribosylglycinamide formyltransferase 1
VIIPPLKLGFLASGNGSSARAICAAIRQGELTAEARLLVSNRREARALDWARVESLAALHIPTLSDPDAADAALAKAMRDHGVNLIILSGYLRHLGPRTLGAFAGRILNIHPGPLPEFGGEGMYGRRVHEAVIAAGVSQSAIVIHGVDEVYDRGPEIARMWVAVEAGDTAETLEDRVTALEPAFFVESLIGITRGDLRLQGSEA